MPRRASLSAPVTVVVTPLECQSNPRTQPKHLLGTAVGNDVRRDLACELRHSCEEPGGRATRMQRQVSEASSTGHVSSYGILRWSKGTTLRASGSNPKFRMKPV